MYEDRRKKKNSSRNQSRCRKPREQFAQLRTTVQDDSEQHDPAPTLPVQDRNERHDQLPALTVKDDNEQHYQLQALKVQFEMERVKMLETIHDLQGQVKQLTEQVRFSQDAEQRLAIMQRRCHWYENVKDLVSCEIRAGALPLDSLPSWCKFEGDYMKSCCQGV